MNSPRCANCGVKFPGSPTCIKCGEDPTKVPVGKQGRMPGATRRRKKHGRN